MSTHFDPSNYRIVGAAPGESIEQAWNALVMASPLRPGVQPPTSCQLVDPPESPGEEGAWAKAWFAKLEFGEAVGWPSYMMGPTQWYKCVGISTPLGSG